MNSREVKINIGYVFETSGGWTFPFLFLLTSHHYLVLDSQSVKRVSQNEGILATLSFNAHKCIDISKY